MDTGINHFRRQDTNLAEIVQLGITLQVLSGRKNAEHYLVRKGVDAAIIERVLSPGKGRRIR